jgi:hypothetical protein
MHVGIALVTLLTAAVMSLAIASRRRRRARVGGGLDLDITAQLLPAGMKHLGARLSEPLSRGLRIPPPHAASGARRLGTLLPPLR